MQSNKKIAKLKNKIFQKGLYEIQIKSKLYLRNLNSLQIKFSDIYQFSIKYQQVI